MTSLAGRLWQRARQPGVIGRAAIADRIATRHERLVAPLPLAAVAGRYSGAGTGLVPDGGELPVAHARPAPAERSRPAAPAPAPSGPPVIQLKALPAAPAPAPPAAPPLSVVTGHGERHSGGGPRPAASPAPGLALASALPPRLARPGPADGVPAGLGPADLGPAHPMPAGRVPAGRGPVTPGSVTPGSVTPGSVTPSSAAFERPDSGPGTGRAQPGLPPTVLVPPPFSSPAPASLLADAPEPSFGLRATPAPDGGPALDRSRAVTAAPPVPGPDGHAMPPPVAPVRLLAAPATVTPPATVAPATEALPATTTPATQARPVLAARPAQVPATGPAGTALAGAPAEDAFVVPSLPGQPATASVIAHPVARLPLRGPGLTAVPADSPRAGAAPAAIVGGAVPLPVVTATARPAAAAWPGSAVSAAAQGAMTRPARAPGGALAWPQPFATVAGGRGASLARGGVPAVLPLAGLGSPIAGAPGQEQAALAAPSRTSRVPGTAATAPAGAAATGATTMAPRESRPSKPEADRVDLDWLAGQVQRRVVRQLAIEAERRRFR